GPPEYPGRFCVERGVLPDGPAVGDDGRLTPAWALAAQRLAQPTQIAGQVPRQRIEGELYEGWPACRRKEASQDEGIRGTAGARASTGPLPCSGPSVAARRLAGRGDEAGRGRGATPNNLPNPHARHGPALSPAPAATAAWPGRARGLPFQLSRRDPEKET